MTEKKRKEKSKNLKDEPTNTKEAFEFLDKFLDSPRIGNELQLYLDDNMIEKHVHVLKTLQKNTSVISSAIRENITPDGKIQRKDQTILLDTIVNSVMNLSEDLNIKELTTEKGDAFTNLERDLSVARKIYVDGKMIAKSKYYRDMCKSGSYLNLTTVEKEKKTKASKIVFNFLENEYKDKDNFALDPKNIKSINEAETSEGLKGKTKFGIYMGVNVCIKPTQLNEEQMKDYIREYKKLDGRYNVKIMGYFLGKDVKEYFRIKKESLEKTKGEIHTEEFDNEIKEIEELQNWDDNTYYIVSLKEKRRLIEKKKDLSRRISYLKSLLKGLYLLNKRNIHHGSLHKGNILLSAQGEIKLDDIGYAYKIPKDYTLVEEYKKYFPENYDPENKSDNQKEIEDMFSFYQFCEDYLSSEVINKRQKKKLTEILKDYKANITSINDLNEKFSKFNLSGPIDHFWKIVVNDVEKIEFINFF